MQCMSETHKNITEVLPVVLQHPAVAADQRNICSILQVCKPWRTAVQQSTACITDVTFKKVVPEGSSAATTDLMANLARLAQWISSYAGTVRSIHLHLDAQHPLAPDIVVEAAQDNVGFLLQHIVGISLRNLASAQQAARAAPAAPDSSTTFTVGSTASTLSHNCSASSLQLQALTSCCNISTPLVISALLAATLTQLDVTVLDTSPIHEALEGLSNLRSLGLTLEDDPFYGGDIDVGSRADSYLSSINKLSQLDELTMHPVQCTPQLALLPQQLTKLDLHLRCGSDQEPMCVALTHLSKLQQLHLAAYGHNIDAAQLPQQLQQLEIVANGPIATKVDITALLQLQQLMICDLNNTDEPHVLEQIGQMQELRGLELGYHHTAHAPLAAAPAWPHLSQLAALDFNVYGTQVQIAALLESISKLSSLTKLTLVFRLAHIQQHAAEEVEAAAACLRRFCRCLQPITALNELQISLSANHWYGEVIDPHFDILHLSSLRSLTCLSVDFCLDDLEDTALSAVLLELTGLQNLQLWQMNKLHALPVIGKLHELTCLGLHGLSQQQQASALTYLTGLRNLQQLEGFQLCNEATLNQFWGALHV